MILEGTWPVGVWEDIYRRMQREKGQGQRKLPMQPLSQGKRNERHYDSSKYLARIVSGSEF